MFYFCGWLSNFEIEDENTVILDYFGSFISAFTPILLRTVSRVAVDCVQLGGKVSQVVADVFQDTEIRFAYIEGGDVCIWIVFYASREKIANLGKKCNLLLT